jgi:hypothetical protein
MTQPGQTTEQVSVGADGPHEDLRGLDRLRFYLSVAVQLMPGTFAFLSLTGIQFVALFALQQNSLLLQPLGPVLLTIALFVWVRRTGAWTLFVAAWYDPLNRDPGARSWGRQMMPSALLLAVGLFSAWTTLLYQQGWLGLHRVVPHVFFRMEAYYLWHLLDAIPALQVPKTLHWSEHPVIDTTRSGVLLLAFKLVVVIPLLGAIIAMLVSWLRYGNTAPPDEEPSQ